MQTPPWGSGGWTVPGYGELGELGSGATGRVVAAVHEASHRQVAIKYLAPNLVGDTAFMQRFRAEARLLAALQDPNLVAFHEYVESPGAAAIVMELVEGVSLRVLLDRLGPTTPEAALLVLRGSLRGLGAAHRVGVVHRDYKPDNILVQPDGASRLTDFGVAVAAGAQSRAAGTPAYMAPEQWHGTVGPQADVYSATVVFFECLTGHLPYAGSTLPQLAAAHSTAPVPVDQVPEPLRLLISDGMAKNRPGPCAEGRSRRRNHHRRYVLCIHPTRHERAERRRHRDCRCRGLRGHPDQCFGQTRRPPPCREAHDQHQPRRITWAGIERADRLRPAHLRHVRARRAHQHAHRP
jgi:serine/threonine protein kinase